MVDVLGAALMLSMRNLACSTATNNEEEDLRDVHRPIRCTPTPQALVEKSHGEYWLQVSAQRLLKVECAEARHVPDMAKLEACIEKVWQIRGPNVVSY